jgi:hypothetical protein
MLTIGDKKIIITGMHRSGTSMVAGILKEAGVYFGSNFIKQRAPDNPKGFFEDKEFVSINQRILLDSGGDWDNPPNRIRESFLVTRRIKKFLSMWNINRVGFKDPRCCLTIGIWRKHIKDLKVIFVDRYIEEIAESLKKRNGFDYKKSKNICRKYIKSFIENANVPIHFISHNRIIANPELETKKMVEFIELQNVDIKKAASFVDLRFYRNRRPESRENDQTPGIACKFNPT